MNALKSNVIGSMNRHLHLHLNTVSVASHFEWHPVFRLPSLGYCIIFSKGGTHYRLHRKQIDTRANFEDGINLNDPWRACLLCVLRRCLLYVYVVCPLLHPELLHNAHGHHLLIYSDILLLSFNDADVASCSQSPLFENEIT